MDGFTSPLALHLARDMLLLGALFFPVTGLLKRTYQFVVKRKGWAAHLLDPLWWWLPLVAGALVLGLKHWHDAGPIWSLGLGALSGIFTKAIFHGVQKMALEKAAQLLATPAKRKAGSGRVDAPRRRGRGREQ